MILDGHIHIQDGPADKAAFKRGLAASGIGGGLVISLAPNCFRREAPGLLDGAKKRLDGLLQRTRGDENLFPFFWIDPMEPDAERQAEAALGYGVMGFKVICDSYYPYDDKPMALFRAIAGMGKPLLFHSGILWDGKFSSLYNKPANFEALIDIPGLRFSLAHASWPWCDECIALYGKILNAKSEGPGTSAEMFIDITPGTPQIYRRDLLVKLYTVGYDIEDNVVYGSDCSFDDYAGEWSGKWVGIDRAIYNDLKLEQAAVDKAFGGNLRRFVGLGEAKEYRKITPTG